MPGESDRNAQRASFVNTVDFLIAQIERDVEDLDTKVRSSGSSNLLLELLRECRGIAKKNIMGTL